MGRKLLNPELYRHTKQFKIERAIIERLEKYADENGMTFSSATRDVLNKYLPTYE